MNKINWWKVARLVLGLALVIVALIFGQKIIAAVVGFLLGGGEWEIVKRQYDKKEKGFDKQRQENAEARANEEAADAGKTGKALAGSISNNLRRLIDIRKQ